MGDRIDLFGNSVFRDRVFPDQEATGVVEDSGFVFDPTKAKLLEWTPEDQAPYACVVDVREQYTDVSRVRWRFEFVKCVDTARLRDMNWRWSAYLLDALKEIPGWALLALGHVVANPKMLAEAHQRQVWHLDKRIAYERAKAERWKRLALKEDPRRWTRFGVKR